MKRDMFRNVRDDVMEATRNEQQPFVYGSLSRKAIYLAGPPPAGAEGAASPSPLPAAVSPAPPPTPAAPGIDPALVGTWEIMDTPTSDTDSQAKDVQAKDNQVRPDALGDDHKPGPRSATRTPAIIVAIVAAVVAGLSIFYLLRPEPLLVQGEVDATRLDIAARVDGRVKEIPVQRGQNVAAQAVLVRIDNPETIAKRDQMKAAKAVADAQLANIMQVTAGASIFSYQPAKAGSSTAASKPSATDNGGLSQASEDGASGDSSVVQDFLNYAKMNPFDRIFFFFFMPTCS